MLHSKEENESLSSESRSGGSGLSLICEPISPAPFLHEHLFQLGESTGGLCYGENQRTKQLGIFPAKFVYILPTLHRPTSELLSLFDATCNASMDGEQTLTDLDESNSKSLGNTSTTFYVPRLLSSCSGSVTLGKIHSRFSSSAADVRERHQIRRTQHTLQKFASVHFR